MIWDDIDDIDGIHNDESELPGNKGYLMTTRATDDADGLASC